MNYIKESLKGHVELENELGISRNTIRSIRKRFEIKIKKENKLSDKDINNLIIDFKNGFSIQKLAIKYNKDRKWIARLLNNKGLETNKKLSNEQINIILKYLIKNQLLMQLKELVVQKVQFLPYIKDLIKKIIKKYMNI